MNYEPSDNFRESFYYYGPYCVEEYAWDLMDNRAYNGEMFIVGQIDYVNIREGYEFFTDLAF